MKLLENIVNKRFEVTDWSQMILFLKIFNDENLDITYSQFKIIENRPLQIIFTNEKTNTFCITNVEWNSLFE